MRKHIFNNKKTAIYHQSKKTKFTSVRMGWGMSHKHVKYCEESTQRWLRPQLLDICASPPCRVDWWPDKWLNEQISRFILDLQYAVIVRDSPLHSCQRAQMNEAKGPQHQLKKHSNKNDKCNSFCSNNFRFRSKFNVFQWTKKRKMMHFTQIPTAAL